MAPAGKTQDTISQLAFFSSSLLLSLGLQNALEYVAQFGPLVFSKEQTTVRKSSFALSVTDTPVVLKQELFFFTSLWRDPLCGTLRCQPRHAI